MKKIYFLFLLLCISLSARANDTAGYVLPTGGVVFVAHGRRGVSKARRN